MRIGLAGAGRMARSIAALAAERADWVVAGVWARDPCAVRERFPAATPLSDDLDAVVRASQVLIDFSLPGASPAVTAAAVDGRVPLVCGVSGLGAGEFAALEDAAVSIPIVYDRNMSQGIAVLSALVESAARSLGTGFRVRIDETHHLAKRDAPSGTALKLGEAVARGRGRDFAATRWYRPGADPEAAPEEAICFVVERRGEIPGDHDVTFASLSERVTFGHSVTTRDVFAAGALRAARWVVGRPPALYGMRDVLGLGSVP